jgi:hypothetical protein
VDIDYLEDRKPAIYADAMGLTVEELEVLDYREDSEMSGDGFILNHYLEFAAETPWEIMVKIKGLQGSAVYFSSGMFETDDSEPAR